jgi:hypothetical protein
VLIAALLVVLAGAAAAIVALNRGGHDGAPKSDVSSKVSDPFQVGTEWAGEFHFDADHKGTMRVTVTQRQDERFQGTQHTDPGNYGWHIEGSVRDGQVQWGYTAVLAGTAGHAKLVGKGEVNATLKGEVLTGQFFDRSDGTGANLVLRLKK